MLWDRQALVNIVPPLGGAIKNRYSEVKTIFFLSLSLVIERVKDGFKAYY